MKSSCCQIMAFYYVFRTTDPFAIKLGLMAQAGLSSEKMKLFRCVVVVKVTAKIPDSNGRSSG